MQEISITTNKGNSGLGSSMFSRKGISTCYQYKAFQNETQKMKQDQLLIDREEKMNREPMVR